jgi:hypothetical protein
LKSFTSFPTSTIIPATSLPRIFGFGTMQFGTSSKLEVDRVERRCLDFHKYLIIVWHGTRITFTKNEHTRTPIFRIGYCSHVSRIPPPLPPVAINLHSSHTAAISKRGAPSWLIVAFYLCCCVFWRLRVVQKVHTVAALVPVFCTVHNSTNIGARVICTNIVQFLRSTWDGELVMEKFHYWRKVNPLPSP